MSSKSKYFRDDAERYQENNIHIARRLIYLPLEIDEDSAAEFIKNITLLDAASTEKKPINIHINCYGGSVTDAWGMFDRIRQSECEVIGTVYGACMSAATFVLQACDKRIATEHAEFMFHEGSSWSGYDHVRNQEAAVKFQAREMEWMYKVYSDATSMPKHKLKKLFSFDKYYTADEVLDMGFVDEIYENPTPFWLKKKQKEQKRK